MPIKQPDYQLRLELDLPDEQDRSALSVDEIRIRAEAARSKLEAGESWRTHKDPPIWMHEYYQLLAGGWDWRVATYIAWKATPKKYRWPETQEKLATEILGLTSDRQISVWRAKNPAIDAMVKDVGTARVLDRLGDSIEAMLEVASRPDYKGRGDRELHFKMAGVLADELEITDKTGLPDLSKLSYEEKLKMARLTNAEELQAFRNELLERYRKEQHELRAPNKPSEPISETAEETTTMAAAGGSRTSGAAPNSETAEETLGAQKNPVKVIKSEQGIDLSSSEFDIFDKDMRSLDEDEVDE